MEVQEITPAFHTTPLADKEGKGRKQESTDLSTRRKVALPRDVKFHQISSITLHARALCAGEKASPFCPGWEINNHLKCLLKQEVSTVPEPIPLAQISGAQGTGIVA